MPRSNRHSDDDDTPVRNRRRKPNVLPLLLLPGGAGFTLLALLTAGVVLFFVLKPTDSAKPADPSTVAVASPPPKATIPTTSAGPSKPNVKPPTKTDDRKWVAEARVEYLNALEEKERRMSAAQRRLGLMNRAEIETGKEAVKLVQANGLDRSPEAVIRSAEAVAPETIAALRRERVVNSPEYTELVRNGAYPLFHPTAKREELYTEFAAAVGEKAKWSVALRFAALTAKEMDELIEGVRRLKDGGLGKLTKPQRLLLLKAGGLDYFAAQIEK